MGNIISNRHRQVIPICEEETHISEYNDYLYTAILCSPIYTIIPEYTPFNILSADKIPKDVTKVKIQIRLYEHCMELQEYKNPNHIYRSIEYTDIQHFNGIRQNKKKIYIEICGNEPYFLQLEFPAKNVLQEFNNELLSHIQLHLWSQ